jgi:copper chaperone
VGLPGTHAEPSNRGNVKGLNAIFFVYFFRLTLPYGEGSEWSLPTRKLTLQEHTMITFQIDDMTCGHCASIINKALRAIDDQAKVRVDLERRLVSVVSTQATIEDIRDAILEAGYKPTPVEA